MKNTRTNSELSFYELNYLIGLRGNEQIIKIAKKVADWLEKRGGKPVEVKREKTAEIKGGQGSCWVEKRRLAYPIGKEKAGYYLNSWVKISPLAVNEFRRFLKLEGEIIRFTILAESENSNIRPAREAVVLEEIGQLALQSKAKFESAKTENITERVASKKVEAKEIEKQEEKFSPVPGIVEQKEKKIDKKEKEIKPDQEKEKSVFPKGEKETTEKVEEEIKSEKEGKKSDEAGAKSEEEPKNEEKESAKRKKISLEDLDKRLDDILNEDIL